MIASTGHSRTQVGGFAEYVTLPAAQVATAPANLDWTDAATLPLAGLTAYQSLELLDLAPARPWWSTEPGVRWAASLPSSLSREG